MNTTPKKEWYDEKSTVLILCFFIFPVGLYGLWKSNSFEIIHKLLITGAFFIMFIAFISGENIKPMRNIAKTERPKQEYVVRQTHIPGLMPVDVYGNFEQKGYKTTKEFGPEANFWISESEEEGITYYVRTSCVDGVNNVDEVRLMATRSYPQYNNVESMKSFLKYGCSIPFDGNNPKKVNKFIDENYYNDKANITISGVTFTIYAPTEFSRTINIEAK